MTPPAPAVQVATLRRAIAVCRRIARTWDRECQRRIRGDGRESEVAGDDWGDAMARREAAAECVRALERLLHSRKKKG